MTKCTVAIGTTNPIKVRAVQQAFRLLCTPSITVVEITPSVGKQPIGFCQLLQGAIERGEKAMTQARASYGVGLEAGFIEVHGFSIELQLATIIDGSNGTISVGLSSGFLLPSHWVKRILASGEPLGVVASEETRRHDIGKRMGLVGYLSRGLVSRTDLSYEAVLMALLPLLNHSLYGSLPRIDEIKERLKNCKT